MWHKVQWFIWPSSGLVKTMDTKQGMERCCFLNMHIEETLLSLHVQEQIFFFKLQDSKENSSTFSPNQKVKKSPYIFFFLKKKKINSYSFANNSKNEKKKLWISSQV